MPTPLSSVQQCLTPESAKVLDDAVAVARRRNHAQTTSLHVVSALLAIPSSGFREACIRSRFIYSNNRLHSRALELCFSVALDRLPSSHGADDPPISNSLMAAIKRAQAIQRRFSADVAAATAAAAAAAVQSYQQPLSSVKVELQQLILSILDDPIVSRVMAEAGFRSNDVKLSIERPQPPPRFFHRPPLFLCNIVDEPRFSPFTSATAMSTASAAATTPDGFSHCSVKLADVLMADKKRNPLLLSMVGGSGDGLVRDFLAAVEKGEVPEGIKGMKVASLEKELVAKDTDSLKTKLGDVRDMVEGCSRPGVLLNLGDLKCFVDCPAFASSSFLVFVVSAVAQLVAAYQSASKRLWLLATATYEIFMQCQTCYPSMEDDWDLHPLPISSLRPPPRLFPKSSLMESFVPFGGLFATASELKAPLTTSYESMTSWPQSDKNEIGTISSRTAPSAVDNDGVPPWLQGAKVACPSTEPKSTLATDDESVLNAEGDGLHKKESESCRQIHGSFLSHGLDTYRRVGSSSSDCTPLCNTDLGVQSQTQWLGASLEKLTKQSCLLPIPSTRSDSAASQQPRPQGTGRSIDLLPEKYLPGEHHELPSSRTPVTTELALGTLFGPRVVEERDPLMHKGHLKDLSNFTPFKLDLTTGSRPYLRQPSFFHGIDDFNREANTLHRCSPVGKCGSELRTGNVSSSLDSPGRRSDDLTAQFDTSYFKTLCKDLSEKVGRQKDAIYDISTTIMEHRVGNERRHQGASLRGDIWLCFLGLDCVGKKRVASALAETLFGSTKNLISINLSSHGVVADSNLIFGHQQIDGYDIRFRGKTTVDYIAEEISKKPLSVIFLENLDKADLLVQSSLSRAIKTGKFSDSRGKEIGINNSIVVMTAKAAKGQECIFGADAGKYSEERILKAKAWQMHISVEHANDDLCGKQEIHVSGHISKRRDVFGEENKHGALKMTKRLHRLPSMSFDLNISLDESGESSPIHSGNDSNETISENEEEWMDEFVASVHKSVAFKPFNFDNLADDILKQMTKRFESVLGTTARLEIDPRAMDQILAVVWLAEKRCAFDDWVECVLGNGFLEVKKKHAISSAMVVKLVVCPNQFLVEQAPGVCLPAKVLLN
ncbi:protein SMAX1-LIKE 7-like [Nymphaea colorata]|nr:protein SMAX1-LIKE 7-like [Nymphaea colorata]